MGHISNTVGPNKCVESFAPFIEALQSVATFLIVRPEVRQ